MDEDLNLLVLTARTPLDERRHRLRFDREDDLRLISAAGAKIRHDSGGRLLVIEVPTDEGEELLRRLRGARLVPINADLTDLLKDLDETESLFLEALRIRTSRDYREAKNRRKVGETPEERELITGPCIKDY